MTALARRAASRLVIRPYRELGAKRRERRFVSAVLPGPEALEAYRREVTESGLVEHLRSRAREFRAQAGGEANGRAYRMGTIEVREGVLLYALVRERKPRVAVETGVCNGFSTAFTLLGLARNGEGELHSVDFPEVAGEDYEPGTFWEGKGGAVVPPGREPGWVIPEELRERWSLVLGRSQDELPPLLERLGAIDSFMHDSEHSYECMRFEYEHAWDALREGGVLLSDDVNQSPAFREFARERDREPVHLGPGLAFLLK
jgi:predicted O-methyltransferase YrrM